jgi:hypothetical protein
MVPQACHACELLHQVVLEYFASTAMYLRSICNCVLLYSYVRAQYTHLLSQIAVLAIPAIHYCMVQQTMSVTSHSQKTHMYNVWYIASLRNPSKIQSVPPVLPLLLLLAYYYSLYSGDCCLLLPLLPNIIAADTAATVMTVAVTKWLQVLLLLPTCYKCCCYCCYCCCVC